MGTCISRHGCSYAFAHMIPNPGLPHRDAQKGTGANTCEKAVYGIADQKARFESSRAYHNLLSYQEKRSRPRAAFVITGDYAKVCILCPTIRHGRNVMMGVEKRMRIPASLADCTVFISEQYDSMGGKLRFGATAFFVSVPDEAYPSGQRVCLVTAKHVGERLNGKKFTIRHNTMSGGSIPVHVQADVTWWFHPEDDAVDVALLSLSSPPHDDLKVTVIPSSMFVSEDDFVAGRIGLGSDVSIVGLFKLMAGDTKNFPIVRVGNIAMLPTDKVVTERYGPADLHLIDAMSINGLSGSPVFVTQQSGADYTFHLLGLIHGHYNMPAITREPSDSRTSLTEKILANIGISMVVPARKILEVANQPKLSPPKN